MEVAPLDIKVTLVTCFFLERAAGIEPATLAWKARALPLCNARSVLGHGSILGRLMVGRVGFEPTYRVSGPDLQSGAFNHSTTYPRWRLVWLR